MKNNDGNITIYHYSIIRILALIFVKKMPTPENLSMTESETFSEENLVRLISSDEKVFIVPIEVATQSELLCAILNPASPFIEAVDKTVSLPIRAKFLARAIEYMSFKYEYKDNVSEAPEFIVGDDESIPLLEISSYLKL